MVERYRFGSRTADYLLCRRCGVYVGAVCETSSGVRAVVNVNCLDDRANFTQTPAAPDYDGEATDARLDRRATNWMPGGTILRRSRNEVVSLRCPRHQSLVPRLIVQVAGDKPFVHPHQRRLLLAAHRHHVRAARVEATA